MRMIKEVSGMTESQRKTPDREKVMSNLQAIRLYHSLKKHSMAVDAIDDVVALLKEQEPVKTYGAVLRFDENVTYGHLYTAICEALIALGVLDVRDASEDKLAWKWQIKAVKWNATD